MGHLLQVCYVAGGRPPWPRTPSPWEPHIIKELRALRSCVSEGGQAVQGKNLLTSSADLRVRIHQHLVSRLQALPHISWDRVEGSPLTFLSFSPKS